MQAPTPTTLGSSTLVRPLLSLAACLVLLPACDPGAAAKTVQDKVEQTIENSGGEKAAEGEAQPAGAAAAAAGDKSCLSEFGYVWNEQRGRCMDPAGACNQGFTLNTSTNNCDVNQAAVCALPPSDPLNGLCEAAPAAPAAPTKVEKQACLSEFGYVWNEQRGRCMDPAGACNQGFTLNASKDNCDVNQAAVCALPATDPLHGLCTGAEDEPAAKVEKQECLSEFGYVWNDKWGRCMDAQGACNQGFTLNASNDNCDVNQAAVCALPATDPLHGLCKGDPAEPDETDAKGCLEHLGYVWNEHWGRCMDAQGACNQGFSLNPAKGECEVNQTAVCMLPDSDPLHALCEAKRAPDAAAATGDSRIGPAQPETIYATPKVHSEAVVMVVENHTSETVYVWWHSYEHVAELRTPLAPGESFTEGTFGSHVWTANLVDGKEVAHYVAPNGGAVTWVIDDPTKTDSHGCLTNYGYVWNAAHERCMDAQGACNQGFLLDAEAGKCEVYEVVVCSLPKSDPLSGLCKS